MPLYDEDGDGTYSGTFDIPADMMQFKVFTAATDWYSTDSFFGSYTESQPKLYSDREYSAFLYSGATGGYNCEVSNWQGGEVTFNITPAYDDAGAISYLSLNLVAPTQPAAPLMPKQLFCIGDFNDWALPELPENEDEDAVLNGSLAIDLAEGSFDVYWEDLNIPAGSKEFMFYTINPNNGEAVYFGSNPKEAATPVSFCLYYLAPGYTAEIVSASSRDNVLPFVIYNWQGNHISTTITYENQKVSFGATDGPAFPLKDTDKFYAILTLDDQEPYMTEVDMTDTNMFWHLNYVGFYDNLSKMSVIFTTEASLTPSEESCWGAPEALEIDLSSAGVSKALPTTFIPGGKPITFTAPGEGYRLKLTIDAQLVTGTTLVTASSDDIPGTHLYLVGAPQGWNINDDSMELDKIGDGIFHYTFDIPEGQAQFRFYTKLGDWRYYSIGAAWEDFAVVQLYGEELPYSSYLCDGGLGNWEITDWEGGALYMRVNLKDSTVYFEKMEDSGVGAIEEAPEADALYFNLQGQRVMNPSEGLYIRVVNGKSEKVML